LDRGSRSTTKVSNKNGSSAANESICPNVSAVAIEKASAEVVGVVPFAAEAKRARICRAANRVAARKKTAKKR